jgi:hypothetical protein
LTTTGLGVAPNIPFSQKGKMQNLTPFFLSQDNYLTWPASSQYHHIDNLSCLLFIYVDLRQVILLNKALLFFNNHLINKTGSPNDHPSLGTF